MSSLTFSVQNQWGGDSKPWHPGGLWVIGGREGQPVVALDLTSEDDGQSLQGTMTYRGEGPIGFRATRLATNTFAVENQWGGNTAPWHPGGTWVLGGRGDQAMVAIKVTSKDNGATLEGTMTYNGEGPIGFKSEHEATGALYTVENQWGGSQAPWHYGGLWVIGGRNNQSVDAVHVTSPDNGKSLDGNMVYHGEGPIGFQGKQVCGNTYDVANQWGGDKAPWHKGGAWLIGCRGPQLPVGLQITSSNNGASFSGTMTYDGEGPIGFRAKKA